MEETREIDTQVPANTDAAAKTPPSVVAVHQLQTTTQDPFQARRQIAWKLVQAIYVVFGAIEALIAIRFVLRLFGANPTASFAEWTYGMTNWLAAPFAGLFSAQHIQTGVLEFNVLVALVVYGLLAVLLGKIVRLAVGETRTGLVARRRYLRTDMQ
jgi:uncharacterized protein YggT (Ycf19 family)